MLQTSSEQSRAVQDNDAADGIVPEPKGTTLVPAPEHRILTESTGPVENCKPSSCRGRISFRTNFFRQGDRRNAIPFDSGAPGILLRQAAGRGLGCQRPPTGAALHKRQNQPHRDQGFRAGNGNAEIEATHDVRKLELGLFAGQCSSPCILSALKTSRMGPGFVPIQDSVFIAIYLGG